MHFLINVKSSLTGHSQVKIVCPFPRLVFYHLTTIIHLNLISFSDSTEGRLDLRHNCIRVFHIWIRIVKIKVNNHHSVDPRPRRRNAKRINPNFPRTANRKQDVHRAQPSRLSAPYPSFISACPLGAPVYGGGEVSSGQPDRWTLC